MLAEEALSLSETMSEAIFIKALLKEMSGEEDGRIPIEIITDSKNLDKSLVGMGLVKDPRLRLDITSIKEMIEQGEVAKIVCVHCKEMIVDCLTMKGASAKKLLELIRTGNRMTQSK